MSALGGFDGSQDAAGTRACATDMGICYACRWFWALLLLVTQYENVPSTRESIRPVNDGRDTKKISLPGTGTVPSQSCFFSLIRLVRLRLSQPAPLHHLKESRHHFRYTKGSGVCPRQLSYIPCCQSINTSRRTGFPSGKSKGAFVLHTTTRAW